PTPSCFWPATAPTGPPDTFFPWTADWWKRSCGRLSVFSYQSNHAFASVERLKRRGRVRSGAVDAGRATEEGGSADLQVCGSYLRNSMRLACQLISIAASARGSRHRMQAVLK